MKIFKNVTGLFAILGLMIWSAIASATQPPQFNPPEAPVHGATYRIQNIWMTDLFINIEGGVLKASTASSGWHSSHWIFEKVGSYYRIKNRWKPTHYLHMENGQLQAGPIQSHWHSAQWSVVVAQNPPAIWQNKAWNIGNRWLSDKFLHVEPGTLTAGPIQPSWWSAQWNFAPVGN